VESVRDDLLAGLGEIRPRPTNIAIGSSLTGGIVEPARLGTDHWYQTLRNPVRFEQAIRAFVAVGAPLFIEVSPHPVLRGDIEDIRDAAELAGGGCTTLRRGQGDWTRFVGSVAQAYALGVDVSWPAVLGPAPDRRVAVPTYKEL
jgi:polyketide synthase 7